MITLRLYLENISGDWFGWIEGYPGAFSQGATPHEVEQSAARDFADYLGWLKAHGELVAPEVQRLMSADFTPVVADTIPGFVDAPWEARHTFPRDGQPMPAHEFERHLRLLRCTRADLSEAVHAIPPHEWDMAPLGEQSIRALLQRIATCEIALLERLSIDPTERVHPDPWTNLMRLRIAFESAVQEAFDRSDANHRALPSVLRLAIWHERRTTREIAVRSNPAAYLRSVIGDSAVVRQREAGFQPEYNTTAKEEAVSISRHTHESAYYY